MARNEEKAQSMLNRWLKLKSGGFDKENTRRPGNSQKVDTVSECLHWRATLVREIKQKFDQIQNRALPEARIRQLNDEINRLISIKRHWQNRIKELGGRVYDDGGNQLDDEGQEIPGTATYKYFGAAKDLPGVKELFASKRGELDGIIGTKRTRGELHKMVDVRYFGFRDDDDGILKPLEDEAENKAVAEAIDEWNTVQESKPESERVRKPGESEDDHSKFASHVPLPSQDEIEAALVEQRKAALLAKYASEDAEESSNKKKKKQEYPLGMRPTV